MSRPLFFVATLAAGGLLFCQAGFAQEPTPREAPGRDRAVESDELAAVKVQITSAARTTLEDSPFVGLACRLSNPSKAPLMFVGYRSDSFDPPLEKGSFSSIYVVELQRGDKWERHPIGWCGTGIDGIALAAKENGVFGVSVPVEPAWTALRVGVRWSPPLDFANAKSDDFQVAWSDPLTLDELDNAARIQGEPAGEEDPPPSKTGAIKHGKPAGGLAAFLLSSRGQVKVGEPISLSHGLIRLGPPAGGDAARDRLQKVGRPFPAADRQNRSWMAVTGPDGKELKYQGEFVHWPAMGPDDYVMLRAGEFTGTTSDDLQLSFDLKQPGKYRVRWHYGSGDVALVSNEIDLEIVP